MSRSFFGFFVGAFAEKRISKAVENGQGGSEVFFWKVIGVKVAGVPSTFRRSFGRVGVNRIVKLLLLISATAVFWIGGAEHSPVNAQVDTFKFYNSSRLKEILEKGELKVAGNPADEPFYVPNAKEGYPGFDYELGKAYADFLGVKFTFVPYPEFNEFADAIKKKEADMALSGISSNIERSKRVKFSAAYLISTPAALIRKTSLPPPPEGNIITTQSFRSILDLADVSGVTFAVRSFSNRHEYLLKKFKNNRIFTYGDTPSAWEAVKNGTANCLVADSFYIKGLLLKDKSIASNFRPLLEPVQREDISAAFPSGDLVLIRNFEFFLSELNRSGVLREMEDKYFNKSDWVP